MAAFAGHRLLRVVLGGAVLAGCAAGPPDAFSLGLARQDDPVCRAAAEAAQEQRAEARSGVVLAAQAGAGPAGTSSTPPAAPRTMPPAIPARCYR